MAGTRQERLSDPIKIKARLKELLGKKINIVLADNRVAFGKLKAVRSEGLVIENLKQKEMSYPFGDIAELYFDTLA
jgi:hypothetical protein